jgi:hypothetical protein
LLTGNVEIDRKMRGSPAPKGDASRLADIPGSCDSQPVSDGRGKNAALAWTAALAAALVVAATAVATVPANDLSAKRHVKFIFLKARVVSDGYITPGQPETISVSRLAPKAPVEVLIEAPPITLQCGELYFCDPAPAAPAPGSPPFRSDKKGRAVLTFITPDTYYLETDPFSPKIRSPVHWMDQQRVHIDVDSSSKSKHVRRESFGFARAIVRLAH